jgi:hypothetical protein
MVRRSSIKNHVMTTFVAVLAVGLLVQPMQVQAGQVSPGEPSVAVQPPVQTQASTSIAKRSDCGCSGKAENQVNEVKSMNEPGEAQPLNSPPGHICIGWGCIIDCLYYGECAEWIDLNYHEFVW